MKNALRQLKQPPAKSILCKTTNSKKVFTQMVFAIPVYAYIEYPLRKKPPRWK